MKKLPRMLAMLLSLALVFSLAACGSGNSSDELSGESSSSETSSGNIQDATEVSAATDNDLVIAIEGSVSSLDPHNISDTNAISATRGMYETLVTFNDDMEFISLLATDWTISDDGLVYTFTLQEGVTFHDGTAFNADAVVANFDRIYNADNGLTAYNTWTKALDDGSRMNRLASYTALDEYTVEFVLAEGWSSFLNRLAMVQIICPNCIDEYGNDIMYHPCGTGPYVYSEWVEGDHTTMLRNDDYWGELPGVDSVTIQEVPEAGTRTAMLQTGEADFVYPMTSDQIAAVSGDSTITIAASQSNIMRYVTLNCNLDVLSDVRVRQAINYAVDKDAYIEVMYSGYATEATSVFPEIISYYAEQTPYDYDLEKAQALMEEAGYADGFDLTIWCDNTTQEIKGATFIQQQLSQININVTVVPYDAGTMDADIYVEEEEATIQMWYVNWSASAFDADSSVRALLYSGSIPPTSANTAYFRNSEFDTLLDEALAIADPDTLTDLYAQAQAIAWEECPWIFLAVDQILTGYQSYVSGVSVAPDGRIIYNTASIYQ